MTDILRQGATELARSIREGSLSSEATVDAHPARIAAVNPTLHAVVALSETARDEARAADRRSASAATPAAAFAGPPTAAASSGSNRRPVSCR